MTRVSRKRRGCTPIMSRAIGLGFRVAFGFVASGFSASAQVLTHYTRADGKVMDALLYQLGPSRNCPPLAIISHGYNGDMNHNRPMARALSLAGFRVVAPNHDESGPKLPQFLTSISAPALQPRPPVNPRLLNLRIDDISAILSAEMKRCRPPFLLMAGHSMGAHTALIEAGARNSAGIVGRNRFDAYIAASSLGEGSDMFPKGAMAGLKKPVLIVTGTRDRAVNGPYQTRLTTFEGLPAGRKRLALIDAADHIELGGRGNSNVGEIVGQLAAEFAYQAGASSWRPAQPRMGVAIREK